MAETAKFGIILLIFVSLLGWSLRQRYREHRYLRTIIWVSGFLALVLTFLARAPLHGTILDRTLTTAGVILAFIMVAAIVWLVVSVRRSNPQ